MKKTANYDLNQWEKQDRIMMEDFNADNAKIDAALDLLSTRSHPILLRSWTAETSTGNVDLDVTGIDWGGYALVILSLRAPGDITFSVRVNGGGSSTYSGVFAADNDTQHYRMIFPTLYNTNAKLNGLCMGRVLCCGTSACLIPEVEVINFTFNPRPPVGCIYDIWGVL